MQPYGPWVAVDLRDAALVVGATLLPSACCRQGAPGQAAQQYDVLVGEASVDVLDQYLR